MSCIFCEVLDEDLKRRRDDRQALHTFVSQLC